MPVPLLFLVADTGGGHRAAARAVAQALHRDYPGAFAPVLCDPLGGPRAPALLRRVAGLYGPAIRCAPWLWGVIYHGCDSRPAVRLLRATLLALADRPVVDAVARHRPAAVVSFHPLTGPAAARARDVAAPRVPVVTVVTDLVNIHASWRPALATHALGARAVRGTSGDHPARCDPASGRDATLGRDAALGCGAGSGCDTGLGCEAMADRGAGADRIVVPPTASRLPWPPGKSSPRRVDIGLPVAAEFAAGPPLPHERRALRRALGLDEHRFLVLLTGGGEGAGGIGRRVAAILRQCDDVGVVALCGRNRGLRDNLAALAARSAGRLIVRGFVENMAQWLRCADVVVGKAGPGTIAEAACCGTPMLLTSHLPGQESGNIEVVVGAGAGRYVPTVRRLVRDLDVLRRDPAAIDAMRVAAAGLGRPGAAADIAALLAGLAHVEIPAAAGRTGTSRTGTSRTGTRQRRGARERGEEEPCASGER
ncbi:glycosyltransferase [Rugosimonospora acidiphila]|uniref:glycosyltransferase n=1 Tax=Rugosimonospora acidiphila TaxID=556531 RepID=UPI0031ED382F